jgi:23S rRNA (uracil1939-C5)-methyltransferase
VLRLGLDKVRFQQANLSKDSSWSMVRDFAPQSIILDPPRTGARGIGHHVTAIDSAQRLVWVSCDVINTLRDMQPLLAQGWEIGSMILLDMFPGTWHMEIVLVLDRC